MIELIGNPYLYLLFFAYWIFNAFVYALPEPSDSLGLSKAGSIWYGIAYKFLNTLAGNIQEAFKSKVPGANK